MYKYGYLRTESTELRNWHKEQDKLPQANHESNAIKVRQSLNPLPLTSSKTTKALTLSLNIPQIPMLPPQMLRDLISTTISLASRLRTVNDRA